MSTPFFLSSIFRLFLDPSASNWVLDLDRLIVHKTVRKIGYPASIKVINVEIVFLKVLTYHQVFFPRLPPTLKAM